jgi:hypothetical protein
MRPRAASVQRLRRGPSSHRRPKRAVPDPSVQRMIGTVWRSRAAHRVVIEVNVELVHGELAVARGRRLGLDPRVDAAILKVRKLLTPTRTPRRRRTSDEPDRCRRKSCQALNLRVSIVSNKFGERVTITRPSALPLTLTLTIAPEPCDHRTVGSRFVTRSVGPGPQTV